MIGVMLAGGRLSAVGGRLVGRPKRLRRPVARACSGVFGVASSQQQRAARRPAYGFSASTTGALAQAQPVPTPSDSPLGLHLL